MTIDKKFTKIGQKKIGQKLGRKLKMDKNGQKTDNWTKGGQKVAETTKSTKFRQKQDKINKNSKSGLAKLDKK